MLLAEYKMTLAGFDAEAEGYSKRNALFLGEASEAAYGSALPEDANGMHGWAKMVGFAECIPFQAESGLFHTGSVEGFVAKAEHVLLVCFRGTDQTVGDWLMDLHTTPAHDAVVPGEVHKGFQYGLLAVWEQIRPHLEARGNRRVWVTGHSLGGALAVACAARATFMTPRVGIRGVYTFGQPRYGDSKCALACASFLGSVLFRHVNDRDVVPRVPPFVPGFRHWGAEILFDRLHVAHFHDSSVEELADLLRRFLVNPLDFHAIGALLQGKAEEAALRRLKEDSFQVATDHFMAAAYLPILRKEAGF